MGLTFAPLSTALLTKVTERDRATASGVNSTIREVGVALGIAILVAVFLGAGGAFTPAAYVDGLVPALTVGAGTVAPAALASMLFAAGGAGRLITPGAHSACRGVLVVGRPIGIGIARVHLALTQLR